MGHPTLEGVLNQETAFQLRFCPHPPTHCVTLGHPLPSLECSLLICKMRGPDGATSKPTRISGSGALGVNDVLDCAVPRRSQEVGVQACYEAATQLLPLLILISFLPVRHGGLYERFQELPPAFGKANGAKTLEHPHPRLLANRPKSSLQ